jgi:hypothetical protein
MWGVLAQSFSGPSPAGYFTVADSRLPQPGGPGPRIYIPPQIKWPSYTPQALVSLFVAYDLQGYGGGIRTRLHTGLPTELSSSCSRYSLGADRIENTVSSNSVLWLHVFVAAVTFIGRSLSAAVSSDSTIPVSQLPCHNIIIVWLENLNDNIT